MSLIDMHGGLGRIDGGYGFAINSPEFVIEFQHDENPSTTGWNYSGPDNYGELIKEIIAQISTRFGITYSNLQISINQEIPPHIGLGSKTQLALSIAQGLCELKNLHPSIEELTQLVRRGGTSGVGYRIFAEGGFVLDGGHSFGPGKEKTTFLPSSASRAPPPPTLLRYPLNAAWRILLITLHVKPGANKQEEVDIFQRHCPVKASDVAEISHRILMLLLPGFAQQNLEWIAQAQRFINHHGFKAIELGLQHIAVQELLRWIEETYPYPSGMSSFGPTLYLIAPTDVDANSLKNEIQTKISNSYQNIGGSISIVQPRNTGSINEDIG
jgi:beta-ribofuranosylaminobenzene 5'-phosphate synthase